MSVRQNTAVAAPQVRANAGNVSTNRNLGNALTNRNAFQPQQTDLDQQQQQQQDELDPSYFQPSALATNSTLMLRQIPAGNYPTTCWFEPLGYCQSGMNRNGWCSWHVRYMFNGQSIGVNYAVMNDDKLEIVKYNRLLASIPMRYSPTLVRVFPIIEMYQSLEELERDLNFGLLHYTLSHSLPRRSQAEVDRIVLEHKIYFMLMMEACASNSETSSRNIEIPAIVRINTQNVYRYVTNQLLNKDYQIHLAVRDTDTQSLRHLDLRRCTILTQSIALLFDLPYAFNADMNISISNPPAFQIARNDLVVEEAKMFNGTYLLPDGCSTLGSPCTISMFRFDTNGEVSFYDKNYTPTRETCLSTNVDKRQLLAYANPPEGANPAVGGV